jgi:hypothetical protein
MAGGKREGAGRKAGGKNKRTLAAEELRTRILDEGESPLEVMIGNMRTAQRRYGTLATELEHFSTGPDADADRVKVLADLHKEVRALMMAAHECAKDAAPYLHPKLANIEVAGSMTLTWEDALEAINDE